MCKRNLHQYISPLSLSLSLSLSLHSLSLCAMAINSEPELVTLSQSEVSNQLNNRMCLDSKFNNQKCIDQEMVNQDAVSPCIVDIYVEKGHSGTPKASQTWEKSKIEHLKRGLQKEINLQIGERLRQLLMNGSVGLPKFISREKSAGERVHETPNSRTRKYKRPASFNSRKVVLLFSVLSIVGTMVLIGLALRVRHVSDGYVNI